MIIVEGPDGTGKSTLVREICDRYGLREPYLEADSREEMWQATKERAYKAIADAVFGANEPKVYDRVFFSELVYGPIWRGECAFNKEEIDHIQGVLVTLGCPVIFCLPGYDTAVENIRNSNQLEGVENHFYEIYRTYEDLAVKAPIISFTYDYNKTDLDYFLSMTVEPYLNTRKERKWR